MSAQRPRVTALVPSYNHGRFLRQRIESILGQTYKNVELIVIDDASRDNSHEIIASLQANYGFRYIRNERNSGTPFAAWESVLPLAAGDYVWICESDDFAEPSFLETAVHALEANEGSVLFYCNSWVIDAAGKRVDHTGTFFREIWKESRWESDFSADGYQELLGFQLRGQTVPNMSSALISTQAFRAAYTPFLRKLKLTGDWLFIGNVIRQGRVVFSRQALNNFRRHDETARVRVKSALSQAEFILTKYILFRGTERPMREFAHIMSTDVVRFLYEPARLGDVLMALLKVSWVSTGRCLALFAVSTLMNRSYIHKFFERYKHAKELAK